MVQITFALTRLENLQLDAAVGAHVREGQLVEARQQQLHVRQKRFQAAHVVIAQSRIQTGIQTRLLRLCEHVTNGQSKLIEQTSVHLSSHHRR